ncbi:hypothetical protein KUCAC02_016462 [Chaenocephalus aceratus]|nr:hypothetical protein KUCAC02_016462 [Chaenocephalus aceratus]
MDDDTQPDDADPSGEAHISLILKELQDFRKDSSQQLNGIKEDINTINNIMEEAEERIDAAETRIHSWEEVVSGLVKLQVQTEAIADGPRGTNMPRECKDIRSRGRSRSHVSIGDRLCGRATN